MNVHEEAKRIMDDFLKELDKVKELKDIGIKREQTMREDGAQSSSIEGFRERMFDNAPKIKNEQLEMERKHW